MKSNENNRVAYTKFIIRLSVTASYYTSVAYAQGMPTCQ